MMAPTPYLTTVRTHGTAAGWEVTRLKAPARASHLVWDDERVGDGEQVQGDERVVGTRYEIQLWL